MSKKPVGLIDLDGTVADFDGAMNEQLRKMASPLEGEPPVFRRDEDPPHMKVRRTFIKNFPGFWRELPRLELGFDIVREMVSLNFSLNVLTKGPGSVPVAFAEKVQWCQKHLPGMPITLSDEKSLVYGRVLVDDWPDYYLPWLQYRPRGLVVAVAHAWNAGTEATHPRVIRYDGRNLEAIKTALRLAAEAT